MIPGLFRRKRIKINGSLQTNSVHFKIEIKHYSKCWHICYLFCDIMFIHHIATKRPNVKWLLPLKLNLLMATEKAVIGSKGGCTIFNL